MDEETRRERLINTLDNATSFSVDDLHPYYHYNISVAAVTVDTGPFSFQASIHMPERGWFHHYKSVGSLPSCL